MLKTFSIIVLFISIINAILIKGRITTKDGKVLGNASVVWLQSVKGAKSEYYGMLMMSILPLYRVIIISNICNIAVTIQTLNIQYQIGLLNAIGGIYMFELHE